MNPTDILVAEHRLIEQVLSCLEALLAQAAAVGRLEQSTALETLDFCRAFADGYHHAKEEAHLFPLMEANGFSGGCSPIAVMQREHELGRLYVQGMAGTAAAAANGDPDALKWFVQHGQSYIKLLREHIRKEDLCLFPAANHRLTDKDQQKLRAAFAAVEAEEIRKGTPAKYQALANALAERFHVPRVDVEIGSHPGGCGCAK